MTSEPTPAPPASRSDQRTRLATAALAVPGVTRLTPTLGSAGLSALHTDLETAEDPAAAIRLTDRTDGPSGADGARTRVAHVDLAIDVNGQRDARTTTHEVQQVLRDTLADLGLTPGHISVTVLSLAEPS